MFFLSEFLHFLKRPQYPSCERKETQVASTAIKIYLVSIIAIGLIDSIKTIILKIFITLPIDETLTVPDSLKERVWLYFLMVSFIAPFYEELLFRLPLIFTPVNISVSVSTLITIVVWIATHSIFAIPVFIVTYLLIFRLTSFHRQSFQAFWERKFTFIFYFLPLLFGLIHISNFKYSEPSQYFIAPILVFPQIAIGFVLSYTRIYYKKGFLISLLIHVLMNLITVTLYLLGN
jgi:hypothetical protein